MLVGSMPLVEKSPRATACWKKDLDRCKRRVHLHQIMLVVLNNERGATRAVFTADCDRLFGGQHCHHECVKASFGLEPSMDRGS
jgi:hypothetical protein